MPDDQDYVVGCKPMGPMSFEVNWVTADTPRAPCHATPCVSCGGCQTCGDFHFYGKGCTPDHCPMQRPVEPD